MDILNEICFNEGMKVIGITGRSASGKGTVAEYLVERYGYTHLSVRKVIKEEVKKELGRDSQSRDELIDIANLIRERHGADYFVLKLYEQAKELGQDCIIESIRTVGEVEALREKADFLLLAVDAPLELRYERVETNNREEIENEISFEEFKAQDLRENTSELKTIQNISKCVLMADAVIGNDWEDDIEALHKEIDIVMEVLNENKEGKIISEKEA